MSKDEPFRLTQPERRARAERQRRAREFSPLYEQVEALLFRSDPIGINFDTNIHEYAPEAETILPRLAGAHSDADVQRIVHEEFVRWFGDEIAGPATKYEAIALELWQMWQAWTSRQSRP